MLGISLSYSTALATAWGFSAFVMLFFGWRVMRKERRHPSQLSYYFSRFALFTGAAYVFYTLAVVRDHYAVGLLWWEVMLGDIFIYLGAAFIARFVWKLLRIRISSRAPFAFFVVVALSSAAMYLFDIFDIFGKTSFYTPVFALLGITIGVFYPVVGAVFFRQGIKHPENRLRSFLVGGAFVVGTVFSVISNFITAPVLNLVFNVLATLGFVLVLLAILIRPERGAMHPE